MSEIPKPEVADAPGLVWRPRKGAWVATWQPRSDIVKAGYSAHTARLWVGVEPSEIERLHISTQCQRLQADMLLWSKGGARLPTIFDGSIRSLINCYQTDPDSRYQKKRYSTRRNHDNTLRRIGKLHGHELIRDIKGRTLIAWHKEWSDHGRMLANGQSFKGLMRVLFAFGFTILEDDECERLCNVMSKMQFEGPKSRNQAITAEQATAIRVTARDKFGWDCVAFAQALQFELMLRQKDVIGEWVPIAEAGISDITWRGQKWLRGINWQEVDANFVLKHVTSKRQKEIEINLMLAPMVVEELALRAGVAPALLTREMFPAAGAMVRDTQTSWPFTDTVFRRRWRKAANAAGIPKTVFNMDSRAGGITEATDADAPMEHVRHAATHSNISMTEKYSRHSAVKAANVQRIRTESRNKPKTE